MKKIETANQKKSWKCFYAEYFGARSAVKLVKDQLNDGFFYAFKWRDQNPNFFCRM